MAWKRTLISSAIVLAGSAMLTGCGSDDAEEQKPKFNIVQPSEEHAEESSNQEQHAPKEVHWSYEGAGAPHFWGDLKAEYATCDKGKSQSPIDISTVTVALQPPLEVSYKSSPIEVVNNGHTIQMNYAPGSYITVNGKKYDLLQFHFHSPSEHTVGGKAYDMVAHLVHKSGDGQLAVVGVLMQAGAINHTVQKVWNQMPKKPGQTKKVEEPLNAAKLLPKDLNYFSYSGSLTTPPCTEGVNWMVLSHPVELSPNQIKAFTDLFFFNNRPVQPLNGRTVILGSN